MTKHKQTDRGSYSRGLGPTTMLKMEKPLSARTLFWITREEVEK